MRSSIMDIHLLSENVHWAFKRAKEQPHTADGLLLAAVACMGAQPPYFHKNMELELVGLPPHSKSKASLTGACYFNQLAHSTLIYDLSLSTPMLRPANDASLNNWGTANGSHLQLVMNNAGMRQRVENIMQHLPRITDPHTPPPSRPLNGCAK